MVYRRRRYTIKKRKEAALQAAVKQIKLSGQEFDAMQWVKERLENAKRGGFVQSIWDTPEKQPGVPWEPYKIPEKT